MKKLIFILALGLVLGISTSALASYTTIYYPTYSEPWLNVNRAGHQSILDHVWGLSNVMRISDGMDQLWKFSGPDASAHADAKFADFSQVLYAGINPVTKHHIFTVPAGGSGYLFGSPSDTFTPAQVGGLIFRFYNDPNGASSPPMFSSVDAENPAYPTGLNIGRDRMVTYKIVGNAGHPDNVIGHYIMAWEDGRDFDYNDIVYEFYGVNPIPEPASMLLLGMGVLGVFGLRKKKA